MIRYRLDDLGGYQFEWLIQSLLKAQYGDTVESWGGHGDHGIDAFSKGPLNFPNIHSAEGPFLFQAKFVENANAAGARPADALIDATTREIGRIKSRRMKGQWKRIEYYVLLTNAPLSADLREKLDTRLGEALAPTRIILYSGNDICDLLDINESLRRSFPQLLSLRDLDMMIADVVKADVIESSRAAIECARDIVPVFVPTAAYLTAWGSLRKHHFVVLDGPPEMGKTAIARMIGLALLSQGWQALVCDTPEDFFKVLNTKAKQVFIADDAFGRTEYNPTRGLEWERSFERVVHCLDVSHWLIWTSRKHILERALRTWDLQGAARKFPNPGEVLVKASDLSIREKALMLYRHARAAGLEPAAKEIVKENAADIVGHLSFTPERIRNFVQDVLPDLVAKKGRGELTDQEVMAEVGRAIHKPTDRMKKAYDGLQDTHKLLLLSLLETGDPAPIETLRQRYATYAPLSSGTVSFETIVGELSEAFVKTI